MERRGKMGEDRVPVVVKDTVDGSRERARERRGGGVAPKKNGG